MNDYSVSVFYTKPTPDTVMFSDCYEMNGIVNGFLKMALYENFEPHGREIYEMRIFSGTWLPIENYKLSSAHYYPHVLIFNDLSLEKINEYLSGIACKCSSIGNVWDVFMEYAELETENYSWSVLPDKEKTLGCDPKFSWRFEKGGLIEPLQEIYDERIIVEISWIFEGVNYSFSGYWYVTSVAFIRERIKNQDPYYRRFMILMGIFNPDEIVIYLQKTIDFLASLEHKDRASFLFHRFEYEGQAMFYER